jgi:diguanylate cyclase (GGDEF)-like protein
VAEQTLHEPTAGLQRLYLRARFALIALLLFILFVLPPFPRDSHRGYMYAILLGMMTLGSIALMSRRANTAFVKALMWVLVPDLVSVAGFTFLFHQAEDAFYPVAILIPVLYALIVTRRESTVVGLSVAVAYVIGHLLGHLFTAPEFLIFILRTAAIPLVSGIVAVSVQQGRRRQAETEQAIAEKASVNVQLQQRLSELQAVSQITELVHSSLDFERIGPSLLSILSKAIGIDTCCLFVIDKEKSETLFSASVGITGAKGAGTSIDVYDLDSHFSCVSVFDHSRSMVLFCAGASDLELLTSEDRLVLGAVASELVVAVENSRLYKLTKKLAVTDELTNLANYRNLQTRLEEEIERSQRYDKRMSLLMIDTDDFKSFNDAYGHMAGDTALADLAGVLRESVREVDLVARYGGEEFSIILPETDTPGAFVVAEKVREAVAGHVFVDANGEACCSLSVSIGIATYPTHAWDRESLLREADDALYDAKNGGKNRVRTPTRRATSPKAPSGQLERSADINDEWAGA